MNKKEIVILSSEQLTMTFEDGSARDFNKVDYATQIRSNSDVFNGFSVLTCYLDAKTFVTTSRFTGKKVQAVFEEIPTKNGVKLRLVNIDGAAL